MQRQIPLQEAFSLQRDTERQDGGIRMSKPPRKGHRKSRSGCFNCKRRKIKCPENLPSCHPCSKVNLACEYPRSLGGNPQTVSQALEIRFQTSPTKFNPTDMRLFQHYLLSAYPHLPLGNDEVWVTDIASLAHSYDFLMHAVLGSAASHITATSDLNLNAEAYSHRIKAIKGLNRALSQPPKTNYDVDALLATCYALTCQSTMMADSIAEILTMLHGAQLILAQHWTEDQETVFRCLGSKGEHAEASTRLQEVPLLDTRKVNAAKASLEQLVPLCVTSIHRKALQGQLDIVHALENSSREAYLKYYDYLVTLTASPHSEFEQIVDACDPIMQILLAHFTGVIALIYPIKRIEWNGRSTRSFKRSAVYEIKSKWTNVASRMRSYLDWPLLITRPSTEQAQYSRLG